MRRFHQREIKPEILDTLPLDQARASLADLVRLNRNFGGHSALRHALRRAEVPRDRPVRVLDVGAASGDMGRVVKAWCPQAHVTSVDLSAEHLEGAGDPRVAADAFRLPFLDQTFDFTYSSLFLHHFTNEMIIQLFREMRRVTQTAVFAVDLHRHAVAYYFVPWTRLVFDWDRVTVHDAAASVAAAFTPGELTALADDAGLRKVSTESHGLSFRISLVGLV